MNLFWNFRKKQDSHKNQIFIFLNIVLATKKSENLQLLVSNWLQFQIWQSSGTFWTRLKSGYFGRKR